MSPYLETGLQFLSATKPSSSTLQKGTQTVDEHRLELLGAIAPNPVVDLGQGERVLHPSALPLSRQGEAKTAYRSRDTRAGRRHLKVGVDIESRAGCPALSVGRGIARLSAQ